MITRMRVGSIMWVTCLSLLFQSTLVQALEVENGLVLYWNFEQVKGKTVQDNIGKFDGEIKDSALKAVQSKNGLGKSMKFDEILQNPLEFC